MYDGIVDIGKGNVRIGKLEVKIEDEKIKKDPDNEMEINVCQKWGNEEYWKMSKLNCPEEWSEKVTGILKENRELINDEVRMARGYEHTLQVDDRKMGKIQTYSVPFHYRNEVRTVLTKMTEDGIIEKATTNIINPLVIVKKKNGSLRLCLDARELNRRTTPQMVLDFEFGFKVLVRDDRDLRPEVGGGAFLNLDRAARVLGSVG
ncbi:uncharacterized protein LOC116179402 [Photinus pyralis]|uniref:uncharacterized protein LOC116178456 n=1 Tax=Photinus pyralis TaxID=7054 RepID=UPI0012673CCC|nr:uncharacterized protein LOC116178456 [Photinus pyralis]XP_031355053.1 uncharacterized protein LOC116179402 [Photinus pyralis]